MDADTTNRAPPDKNEQRYQTLGKKVFWLFFLQISPAAFILLIISIIFFILSFQPFLTNTLGSDMQKYALGATLIIFLISLLIIAGCFAFAWLTYINYVFLMADDSFKIKRGILNKAENAIPYRQIQNVDIERNFVFQMLGLSRLVILTAGHENENAKKTGGYSNEAKGIIPAVDQKLAKWLQAELLRRTRQAEIQKVVSEKK